MSVPDTNLPAGAIQKIAKDLAHMRVLLVDRHDDAATQRDAAAVIAGAAPGSVVVNVGVPVGEPGVAVVDAGAASLLAAEAARARLLAGSA